MQFTNENSKVHKKRTVKNVKKITSSKNFFLLPQKYSKIFLFAKIYFEKSKICTGILLNWNIFEIYNPQILKLVSFKFSYLLYETVVKFISKIVKFVRITILIKYTNANGRVNFYKRKNY